MTPDFIFWALFAAVFMGVVALVQILLLRERVRQLERVASALLTLTCTHSDVITHNVWQGVLK